MKLKGINIFERHAEKAFFLLVTLIFAGVVVWQFALGGNTVDVAGQQGVPVDQAHEQVARLAEQKLGQMQQEQPDSGVPSEVPDAVAQIVDRLAYRGPAGSLPVPMGIPIAGLGEGGQVIEQAGGVAVAAMRIPRPDTVRAGAYAGAIDPLVVASSPELAPFVPVQQPFDLRVATVAARFDSGALLESLRQDPDGDGPLRSIPEPWWRGNIEILDVEVERVEVLADGARSGQALVPPTPARFSLRERLAAGVAPEQMRSLVSEARANARDIVQPPFWPVISGEPWAPPEPDSGEADDEASEIARLLRRLERIRADIARAEEALGVAGDARSAIDLFDPAAGVLAQSLGGRGGGGSGRSGPSAEQLEQERRTRQRAAIEARLSDLRESETAVVARLTAMGVDVEEGTIEQGGGTLPDLPVRIPDAEELTVWSHDPGVEGGRRYAYRLRLVINNPLYGLENNLAEGSKDLAADPVLMSDWTEWTAPISIERDQYWFAARASEGGRQPVGVVAPTATIEVYRFYYGYWRRDEARVRIGDPLTASINIAEQSLPIFQIARPDDGPPVVTGREIRSEPLVAETGALLLDVRPAAMGGRSDSPVGVVVRHETGALATRRPADDLISDLRQRLEQSAGAGLLARVRDPGQGPLGPGAQEPIGDGAPRPAGADGGGRRIRQ